MTTEEIQREIECWASRPTWFSPHPSDAKELRKAISNLKRLSYKPSEDELTEAIYQRVKGLSTMLGTPKDIERSAREFAAKILNKIS
ncbi:hypothetical protein G3485_22950 [Shewanella baltica]|uniref:hypothetical protein n=1 Tax=Shewanella baltica TaxID=62322 RepID=UPI00217EC852|nr:hypothetical protein [Shewanella baltica]MCS6129957.1 hypothetical protein [Shewanella baltica]MCS6141872.1 hypothetical protein [Shewanella baltica]MCS6148221.1 hypothetical protein [Shewanella baltica]MCS6172760.1 hypothetical protein [Shewanella baltica]MCS6189960.1 hypothetical protein [Shewanella baltica]